MAILRATPKRSGRFASSFSRRLAATLLVAVMLLALCPAAMALSDASLSPANLLSNGDFDSPDGTPAVWTSWDNGAAGDTSATFLATGGRDGSAGVQIANTAAIASCYLQSVPLQAGKIYRMSGYIKTENVSSDGYGAGFAFVGYDSSGAWLCETPSDGLRGTHDWTYVSYEFTVPAGVASAMANVRVWFSTGTAWFDDVVLEEIGSAPVNLLSNGDFNSTEGTPAVWTPWDNGTAGDSTPSFRPTGGRNGSACVEIVNDAAVASNYNQSVAMEAGKTYRISGYIKTENISMEGQGAGFAYAGYDAAGNWYCEDYTDGLYGTNDWSFVEKVFTIPAGVASTVATVRIWFSTGTAWFDDVVLEEFTNAPPVTTTHSLTLSAAPNTHTVNAFGCEWDPKLLFYPNVDRGVGQADVDLIVSRLDELNIQRVRMMVLPEWFEPNNDNDDPAVADMSKFLFDGDGDNNEMTSLWLYLDTCQQKGVRVTLTWWGAQTGGSNPWLAYPSSDWLTAPNDLDEMAENISVFLQYAVNTKGYTCIDSLILQNEPYYSFTVADGSVDFGAYVQYYQKVYNRLQTDGLLSQVSLIGSDDSDSFGWYQNSVAQLSDYVSGFNSHCYRWSADDYGVQTSIRNFTSQRTGLTDKPFFYGEFGDGSTQGAYTATSVDTYERGLFLAVHAINTLKAGSTGSLYWPLHDVYYYSGDPNDGSNGGRMKMGLFAYKDDGNWRVRPTYHSWGLVCNNVLPGAQVYDITGDSDWVEAVAAKTQDNKWAILAVNRASSAQIVEIDAAAVGAPLPLTIYSADTVTTSDQILSAASTVTPVDGVYRVEMPAQSFIVLSNVDDAARAAAVLPTGTDA